MMIKMADPMMVVDSNMKLTAEFGSSMSTDGESRSSTEAY